MDQLVADWQEVLDKITKRYAQQAAQAKKSAMAALDGPSPALVDPGATVGQPGPSLVPTPKLDDYGRVSKKWLMEQAQRVKRA